MQTYRCTCNNRLFFENTRCLSCGQEVGWCEACNRITTLEPGAPGQFICAHADCRRPLCKCNNYSIENICNWCFVPVEGDVPLALCRSCRMTETIPDLSIPGNREKWARLEAANRRLLYLLDRLGLPYADPALPLSFDFKADVEPPNDTWRNAGPTEIVFTGHANGKITINIREADDAAREALRVTFHEAHRTLIGHFHHEIGHYYWQLLIEGHREPDFVRVFGDHNAPPYADAMAAYYENGPRDGWNQSFISAYASAHPWEDFAETFALYLDVAAVMDTASHLLRTVRANFHSRSVRPLVRRFQEVGILLNEFNRTVGLIDLAPEIIAEPVLNKLEFIHSMVKRAARTTAAAQPVITSG